ncbi:MAG: response regulator [Desulfobulbaceae bacterium]|nr:response regulator [Desulfobulbaceae bacterium]
MERIPTASPGIQNRMAMTTVDSKVATQEILDNIRSRDLIKAKIVLRSFDHLDLQAKRRILYELSKCEDDLAISLLVSLAVSHPHITELYSTFEETILAKALNNPDIVMQYIKQESAEQLYYIRLAGKMRIQEAAPVLVSILKNSQDPDILLSTLETLGAIGAQETVGVIADFLETYNHLLLNAAIQALGEIATPTAMANLDRGLGKGEDTDRYILDIFGAVQDEVSFHQLNRILLKGKAGLRNYCKSILLSIGSKAVPFLTDNFGINDADLQIHSLNLLQEIGDDAALQPIRNLINSHPKDANVRFAAYEALASLSRRKGDYVLAGGLIDPVEDVRLAAARAIDHNLDEMLLLGIRNMVKRGDAEATRIIKTVINAGARQLFLGLVADRFFQGVAVDYLSRKAHPDIKDTFVTLLAENGMADLADQVSIRAAAVRRNTTLGKICAIDDSQMTLNIYRCILNDLGFEPVLFQYPAQALDWLQEEKPLAICTDLNMPHITGIELTRRAREKYSQEELPIIMVTTQGDSHDHQCAYDAGANAVMGKPFDVEQLGQFLKRVIGEKKNG